MSPTQRTLKLYREMGYTCQVVEKWNPHAKIRQDLFGIIDVLCIKPGRILGVQSCAGASHAARIKKAMAEPRLKLWIEAGGSFSVQSWAKRGPRGKVKRWTCRTSLLTANGDFVLWDAQYDRTLHLLLQRS